MRIDEEIMKINKKLEEHDVKIKELEKILRISKAVKQKVYITSSEEGLEKIAEKTGIEKEKIQMIYDLEEEQLTLLSVVGKDDREKIKNAALLVLLGYKYIFGEDNILSKEIRRNIAVNRITINNFATILNDIIPSFICKKGKPKSPKTTYKLTLRGEAEAKELLKELCKQ